MAEFSKADVEQITSRVMVRMLKQVGTARPDDLAAIIAAEVGSDTPVAEQLKALIGKRIAAALQGVDEEDLVVAVPGVCDCADGEHHCLTVCAVDAIQKGPDGTAIIDRDRCIDCGFCVQACGSGALVERSQCLQIAEMLRARKQPPLYAIVAPAFVAQFGPDVSPAQVKAAILHLGFSNVVEVAMAADVLTVLEADEFLQRVEAGETFMITSCCCPAFIKLVEKHRPLVSHLISETVSPMVALGRMLKSREPDCRVVFIGPCLAKRAESKRPELADAIDNVLTFKELVTLFEAAGVNPGDLPDGDVAAFCEASHDGRIYAHTGGVTAAVQRAVQEKNPNVPFHPLKGNGLKQCSQILQAVEAGEAGGNFMEGMACPGGCVGGPGTCVPVDVGACGVQAFAKQAHVQAARENELASRWSEEAASFTIFYSDKQRGKA